ncbi:hypothetical protein M409DRAFT_69884 [Zasmidium cellare ATCC 36951]|uniref:D-xylose 1-dehydrogenase (NADP(+), D-xylono-1,5-lactone-forming) n=1 Tax=Zasmidium cellare ATCC 36951 TaxID=1080233 RepID=A0A6A6C4U2_ZASCE|nr:uncharacterized protein M409DRAFT_69884 [Zasmidium cellare ATCC 36951]KAF2161278.1 hypothetical protein M409DRAFT_69884 [Zasmidium cellare ATCC 36951]
MSWIGQAMLNLNNWYHGVNKLKASVKKDSNPVRIGVVSAAAINFVALFDPVGTHPGATVVAIGARDKSKAQAQIDHYGLGGTCKAYGSYDEVVNDKDVDAVYIPLPNGLHAEWAIKAMRKGKHVLIEKSITSNAAECREVEKVAKETGKLALEAFHYRFHPAVHRVKELIESGQYGNPKEVFVRMSVPSDAMAKNDIRFQYPLGGGACLDLSYIFSSACYFACPTPSLPTAEITIQTATPRIHPVDAQIDEAIDATFTLEPPPATGKPAVKCHVSGDLNRPYVWGLIPCWIPKMPFARIELERARIEFNNFKDERGRLVAGSKRTEKVWTDGPVWGKRGEVWWSTYRYMVEAFVEGVKAREEGRDVERLPWVGLAESGKMMEVIDAVYERAGLAVRGL